MEEGVIVDLIFKDGRKQRVKGRLKLRIVDHWKWEINKTPNGKPLYGKRGCLVEIVLPPGTVLNFPTSASFRDAFVDKMLECEYENDRFTFPSPVYQNHRPPELLKHIEGLQAILDKWKAKGASA